MNQRLRHDAAYWLAVAIMGLFENCIREEERRDAFEALYEVAKAGIERYDLASVRQCERRKLTPSDN